MNFEIRIEDKELQEFIGKIKDKTIERSVNAAIHKTGAKVKRFVIDDVDDYYEGGPHWFGAAVQKPQNGFMQCAIPLKGTRGIIGQQFKTSGGAYNTGPGGAYGFTGSGSGRKYGKIRSRSGSRIKARIIKGQASTLPNNLENYGGNSPFLYKGVAYTRRTRKRHPIVKVAGIGVPQMPLTRARADIERDIHKELEKNVMEAIERDLF